MSAFDPPHKAVREALNHLYDYAFLRRSPLVGLCGLQGRPDAADSLSALLQAEIKALGPAGVAAGAGLPARRHFELLHCRYIQRMTQHSVAVQLNLSPRHLRREQDAAIEALAERLRARCQHAPSGPLQPSAPVQNPARADQDPGTISGRLPPAPEPLAPADRDAHRGRHSPSVESEMAWLSDSVAGGSADMQAVFDEVRRLGAAVAAAHAVTLSVDSPAGLPAAGVAHTVLTQVVLNLLTAATRSLPGGHITLAASRKRDSLYVELRGRASTSAAAQTLAWDRTVVAVTRRLVQIFGGTVKPAGGLGSLSAGVRVPLLDQALLLAIEDNADTLQLWQRYLQDTPYRLVVAPDSAEALSLAARLQPGLIVLDVMMSGIDGWKLVEQLKGTPTTRHIPTIVCTVLPQEELALALGADGFIRKPVTRREFLAAIERHCPPGSC